MAAWLMTIVGVVCIGVLLDILIPDGEINKYIRGIFGIVVVLVIVAPIPKLVGNGFDMDKIFGGSIAVDQSFVDGINNEKLKKSEKLIAAELNKKIPTVKVRIYTCVNSQDVDVVKVYLDKSKLSEQLENYRDEITVVISKYINLGKGVVKLYAG